MSAPAASGALALAAVTTVLKALLDNRLIEPTVSASVGEVAVSALPPDRIDIGADERSRLNLFLYRTTPHTMLRQGGGPSNGRAALTLDLHYLITAYGERDFHAEILLGHAVQLLLETPLLTPEVINGVTAAHGDNTILAQAAVALTEQHQPIAITPEFLSADETSKLWSALQARYRPSAAFKAATVVVEARKP